MDTKLTFRAGMMQGQRPAPGSDFDQDQQMATRACWLYYMEGQTQGQIARYLGTNRVRVNRMLSAARDNGLVQVRINKRLVGCVELEFALRDLFDVAEVHVVPKPMDPANMRMMVAAQGGRLLSDRLNDDTVVGVGWGRTLQGSLKAMEARPISNLEVVSLIGGLTRGSVMNSYETALRLADMFGAECSYIAGPAFTDTAESRAMLMRQPMIVDALEHARRADIAYISVGALDMESSMMRLGLIGPEDAETLKTSGAIGDLLGYWIDENGEIVDHPLNRRVIALPPDDLAGIACVILVTGGVERYQAIRGALRKGVIDVLVTDEDTAALICGGRFASERGLDAPR